MKRTLKERPYAWFVSEVCAGAPLFLIVLYIALATYARVAVGHWPHYGEYSDLCLASSAFTTLDSSFSLWGVFSLFGLPLMWFLVQVGLLRLRPDPGHRQRLITMYVCGWGIFLILFICNPYGFSSAFIDS